MPTTDKHLNIIIAKSRGTSNGGVTVVQNNDELGMFSFQGV